MGEHPNMEIRIVELKITIIQAKLFSIASTSHTVSPRKCFRLYVHATQSLQGKRFRSQVHHTQFFPLNRLRY